MAKLNHRQLEAFHAVMVAGTVTKAADLLCVSQPAASRLISDFEYAVDLKLFQRVKGRLVATPEAIQLYEEVEKSFVSIEKISKVAEDLKGFRLGALKIAAMPAMALTFLPPVISGFKGTRSGIEITLQVRSSQKVNEWIAGQHFDVGFSEMETTHPAIEVEPLVSAPLLCVLPIGHRLKDKEVIVPEDLRNEVFASLGAEQRLRHNVDEIFDKAKVSRQLAYDTQLSFAACSFVATGNAVALADPITALHFAEQDSVLVKKFEPQTCISYNIVYPALRPRSQMTIAFVEKILVELENLSKKSGDLFVFNSLSD